MCAHSFEKGKAEYVHRRLTVRGIECEGLHRESVQRSASVCGRRKRNFSWSSSDCHCAFARLVVATIFRPPAIASDHLPSVRFDSTPQSPTSILGVQQLVVLLLHCDGDFGCSECTAISKGLTSSSSRKFGNAGRTCWLRRCCWCSRRRSCWRHLIGLAGIFDILKVTIDFGLVHSTNFISDKVRGFL